MDFFNISATGSGGLELDEGEHGVGARPPPAVQLHHLREGGQRARREQPRLRRRQDRGARTVTPHRRWRWIQGPSHMKSISLQNVQIFDPLSIYSRNLPPLNFFSAYGIPLPVF